MNSYKISKLQYDFLLPICSNNPKMLSRPSRFTIVDDYYFIGSYEEYLDMLNRCLYLKD